jgi:transcriptional regulator with AAA-type ATPase domain
MATLMPYQNPTHDQDFIVASDVMRKFMGMVERVARHAGTVLIIGETGTGKEKIAHSIHELSLRAGQPFVDINCAALPEQLVESELFGYEKGAFSGANAAKAGLFEMAHTGTIFLDEIGELDSKVQVKLLRVLDRAPYYRLGGHRKVITDVRVVAATNRNLKQEVSAGRFRKDLYHRLSQFELCVPPLRERSEDIVAIAKNLLARNESGLQFSPEALETLRTYAWPGNVRELQNVVNKVVFAAAGSEIQASEICRELSHSDEAMNDPAETPLFDFPQNTYTVQAIQKALADAGGHRGQAAVQLGISRRTLSRKLRDLKLSSSRAATPVVLGSLSDEERQHFRATIRVAATLTTRDGVELTCSTNNLGASGMGLEGLTTVLGFRSQVKVRFQFPDAHVPVEAAATLAWADKQGGAGIIFTDLSTETRHEINRWLYQQMAEEGWSVPQLLADTVGAPLKTSPSQPDLA